MKKLIVGTSQKLQKLNNSEIDIIPNYGWTTYITLIRDLATDLDLFNPATFDYGHPVFMALDRTSWKMTKDDCQFVENVIGYYREHLDWRKAIAAKMSAFTPAAHAHAEAHGSALFGSERREG